MIRLDGDDLEAVYYAVGGYMRHQRLDDRPVPGPVLAAFRSLELAISVDGNESDWEAGESKQWLSTEEVAEMLGCTPRNVRYLADLGHLDAYKIGRTWVYSKQAVEEYADGRRPAQAG